MNIKVGAFPPSSHSQKMNLELLMGRGAASPHLKPLSGLANLFVCVSSQALPPQRHDPVDKMANIYGSWAWKGPARWSCICFASSSHSIASPDSAYVVLLPELCHEQQFLSLFHIRR